MLLTEPLISAQSHRTFSRVTLTQSLGALLYEAVLLFGVLFFVSALIHTLWPAADAHPTGLRVAMVAAMGLYFIWCWHKTGQTLAMKTWHVRLVGRASVPISWQRALLRYCLSWWLLLPGYGVVFFADLTGMTALWTLILGFAVAWSTRYLDPQHRGLHDRIAKTRMESVRKTKDQDLRAAS